MKDKQGERTSYVNVWRMMWPSVRPFWWVVLVTIAISFGIAITNVIEPYIYGSIIDSVTHSVSTKLSAPQGFEEIIPYLFAWAMVVLGGSLLVAFHAWMVWYLGNRVEQIFGERAFQKILTLSVRRFQDERGGAMLQRFSSGKEALWTIIPQFLRAFAPAIATILIIVGVGLSLDWRLTLAALSVVPIEAFIGIVNLRVSLKRQESMNDRWEETTGVAADAFSNITTVQSEAGEGRVFSRFAKLYLGIMKEQLKLNMQWATLEAGSSGVYIIGRLIIFCVGIQLVLGGEVSLGTLIMFLGFSGSLYGGVQTLFFGLPEIARALNRLERLARVWYEVPEILDTPNAVPAPRLQGEVELDRVSFSYGEGAVVLRGVSLVVPAGKTLAIIGESGAGKSTLAKLLVRFADPTKGSVKVDGIDLRDMTLATLRPQVGFVMQENLLFHDSILYNIQFGKQGASREEVIEAAKRAQAHGFISKLPNGYDTVVGERGVKLSGGQKQRIALARVLLSDPPILVLDEATSALDSKTEHDLQQALKEVMKNRTTIVIAHRLSTVMNADMILVMDKGKIVDQGRHEDLIGRDGLYKQFWNIQAGGYV